MVNDFESSKITLEAFKKSIILFPGLTKAFVDKEKAVSFINYFSMQEGANQLLKVIFCVKLNKTIDSKPLDIDKFLGYNPD
jgi:hypothetical protein